VRKPITTAEANINFAAAFFRFWRIAGSETLSVMKIVVNWMVI